jgi:hypothetical protein
MVIDLLSWGKDEDETDTSKMHIISSLDFKYALKLDRIDILQEIILKTGHGIPIQHLIQKSGIEVHEKPKVQSLEILIKTLNDLRLVLPGTFGVWQQTKGLGDSR